MRVQTVVSTKVTLTPSPQDEPSLPTNTHNVWVAGEEREFILDGALESFIPSQRPGDIRNLREAAKLVQTPEVQAVVDKIRKHDSLGGKIELADRGDWRVTNMLGNISVSRLDPQSGDRHRVTFRQGYLNVYTETQVGDDTVKQSVSGDFDLRSGNYNLTEEWLTVDSRR